MWGLFSSSLLCEKKTSEEDFCQNHLTSKKLHQLLLNVDQENAEKAREKGCPFCKGKLHWARYPRKVGGLSKPDIAVWKWRLSFCCAEEGCRKRVTPASVRFLGRRVYAGLVVVLLSAMVHGLTPYRLQCLREKIGVDARTLERWRKWWLESFPQSPFWKAARARFAPPPCEKTLPWSLRDAFCFEDEQALVKLLRFLSPATLAPAQIHAM